MYKEGDFVRLNYTGYDQETGELFDTTVEEQAKQAGVRQEGHVYEPVVICLGEHHALKGIEKFIEGKEDGKYEVELQPEEGFGKKDAKLIKLMPINNFKKHKINPQPGLEVEVDNQRGLVRSVTGNRVIVDFNHPLAGHRLKYDIEILGKVEDTQTQVEWMVRHLVQAKVPVAVQGEEAIIELPLPEEAIKVIEERLKKRTSIKKLKQKTKDAKPS